MSALTSTTICWVKDCFTVDWFKVSVSHSLHHDFRSVMPGFRVPLEKIYLELFEHWNALWQNSYRFASQHHTSSNPAFNRRCEKQILVCQSLTFNSSCEVRIAWLPFYKNLFVQDLKVKMCTLAPSRRGTRCLKAHFILSICHFTETQCLCRQVHSWNIKILYSCTGWISKIFRWYIMGLSWSAYTYLHINMITCAWLRTHWEHSLSKPVDAGKLLYCISDVFVWCHTDNTLYLLNVGALHHLMKLLVWQEMPWWSMKFGAVWEQHHQTLKNNYAVWMSRKDLSALCFFWWWKSTTHTN